MQKVQRLQTKLDMWSARDLTIFGRAMILKPWDYRNLSILPQT